MKGKRRLYELKGSMKGLLWRTRRNIRVERLVDEEDKEVAKRDREQEKGENECTKRCE